MKTNVVTLLAVALALQVVSFIAPWTQDDGAAEWDDGEHIWGRNVHDHSRMVYSFDEVRDEDDTAVLLRQVAFPVALAALVFTTISLVAALGENRGWTLGTGWPAWLLGASAIGLFVGARLMELTDVADFGFFVGLGAAGFGLILQGVALILAVKLGAEARALQAEIEA